MFTFKQKLIILFNTFMYLLTDKEEYRYFNIVKDFRASIGEHAVTMEYNIKRQGENEFTNYSIVNKGSEVDLYINGMLIGRTVSIRQVMMLNYHCVSVTCNDGQVIDGVIERGELTLYRNGKAL